MTYWWYFVLSRSLASPSGLGVSHIHNLGAVMIGKGAKGQFFDAVCPEIAGRSSDKAAEPLRYLPFSSISTGEGGSHNLGAVMIGEGAKAEFFGSICPEIAGRSSDKAAEPLRYLPFGTISTGEGGS